MENNILELIKKTNEDNGAKIMMKEGVTNTTTLKRGILQGDSLNTTLFKNIIIEILKDAKRQEGKFLQDSRTHSDKNKMYAGQQGTPKI